MKVVTNFCVVYGKSCTIIDSDTYTNCSVGVLLFVIKFDCNAKCLACYNKSK